MFLIKAMLIMSVAQAATQIDISMEMMAAMGKIENSGELQDYWDKVASAERYLKICEGQLTDKEIPTSCYSLMTIFENIGISLHSIWALIEKANEECIEVASTAQDPKLLKNLQKYGRLSTSCSTAISKRILDLNYINEFK